MIELELRFAASAVDVAVFRVWLATVLVLDSVRQVLIAAQVARARSLSLSRARALSLSRVCVCASARARSLSRARSLACTLSD